jgi:hypothetical protein
MTHERRDVAAQTSALISDRACCGGLAMQPGGEGREALLSEV